GEVTGATGRSQRGPSQRIQQPLPLPHLPPGPAAHLPPGPAAHLPPLGLPAHPLPPPALLLLHLLPGHLPQVATHSLFSISTTSIVPITLQVLWSGIVVWRLSLKPLASLAYMPTTRRSTHHLRMRETSNERQIHWRWRLWPEHRRWCISRW